MARKKVRGLDEALDELFTDYKRSLIRAMRYATRRARDDIEWKAKSCLYEYYYNYDPSSYDRWGHLENALIPYMRLGTIATGHVRAEVGMGYWPLMLDGVYNDGSDQWRPVDGWWVLDNYLKGIHPATDGGVYPGAPYLPVVDSQSPTDKMEKYLEEYTKTFNNNIVIAFAKQLTRG